MSLTSRLKNRIDVYGKTEIENELGELDYTYGKIKSIWAEIMPTGGSTKNTEGNILQAQTSHRITIRANAVKELTNDMYFEYKGQRYDIKYFNPNFKYGDSIEVFCELVIR